MFGFDRPPRLLGSFTAHATDGRFFTIEEHQEYTECSLDADIARGQPRFTEGLKRLTTAAPDHWPVELLGRRRYRIRVGIEWVEVVSDDPDAT